MKKMKRKVVFVSGAGNGIGLSMVAALLERGYRVAALDLDLNSLSALQAGYQESLLIFGCDLTDASGVAEAVSETVSCWGGIDILVNNACLAVFGSFEVKAVSDTRREFEVNYFGCLNLIRAVLPCMKKAGSGIIHNVSSGVGLTGFPGIYGYASTKGALESLTRTLALELAPSGITVNLVHPPLTGTRSSAPLGIPAQAMDTPERVGRRLAARIESKKAVITPDPVTGLGLFFSRHFPGPMGRMLAGLAAKARKQGAAA